MILYFKKNVGLGDSVSFYLTYSLKVNPSAKVAQFCVLLRYFFLMGLSFSQRFSYLYLAHILYQVLLSVVDLE